MKQTESLAFEPNMPTPTAVVVVMPGRLRRQMDRHQFGESSDNVLDEVNRTLNHFGGDICGIVIDPEVLQIGLYPKLAATLCSLLYRTKSHAIVYTDGIEERDTNRSSLAIAQQMISKAGLDITRDVIFLTGTGWDGTDYPTDLLGYAFRGLGFSVVLDPRLRMPRQLRAVSG